MKCLFRWIALALVTVAAGGALRIAYLNCDCLPYRRDTMAVQSLPPGCSVLRVPSPWVFSSGGPLVTDWVRVPERSNGLETQSRYQMRREKRGNYLIGLSDLTATPPRTAINSFRLEKSDLRHASAEDWQSAAVIEMGDPFVNSALPIGTWRHFVEYGQLSSPQIAVTMTYRGPKIVGTGFGDFFTPVDGLTPWTIQRTVIAEFNRRPNLSLITPPLQFSMCGTELWMIRGASFHDDFFFTMPLRQDGGVFVFCDFSLAKGKPVLEPR